ncbi:MAG: UvrD-helicase domain-containing protein [Puniceicoccales bacterium]|jgi:ATP-dependent exoDNAse (exonuclease V) beta subunit|nr:UvrD-helicase domain-containing protein [Puniceicoccales bacterium]
MKPQDQLEREIFANEIDGNFSVIAPAGVGKTTAITERIANFVTWDAQTFSNENSRVKNLVAVTYTKKAASEIKDRVFDKIFQKTKHSPPLCEICMKRAESAFFGTIHSFASKFLRSHCAIVGLRNNFTTDIDEDSLWSEFAAKLGDPLAVVPGEVRRDFLCFHDVDGLLSDAKICNCASPRADGTIDPAPLLNLDGILGYECKKGSKIEQFLYFLRKWDDFRKDGDFFRMPDFAEFCEARDFVGFCEGELSGLIRWRQISEEIFVAKIARLYENFRIKEGKLRYDDLINLSLKLLSDGGIIAAMANDPFRVILDEAQDTDAQQFKFLLGISQKTQNRGIISAIPESATIFGNFPEAGYFSMVGDPQQSIYCDRADVGVYMGLHDSFLKAGVSRELTFAVTMRCPTAVVDFVNTTFPKIFTDVNFVKLIARPGSRDGAVNVLKLGNESALATTPTVETRIAELFAEKNPADFGCEKWSDIAILAPRKDWLMALSKTFSADVALPRVQLHFSAQDDNCASPIRWLASCLRYVNNPADRREFAGILRELFAVKSQEIIDYFGRSSGFECADIDAVFSKLRAERYSLPLAKFLLKILEIFKIFQRIGALKTYHERALSEEMKRTVELCYFAEAERMSPVEAADFLEKKIREKWESDDVDHDAVQFLTFHKSKGLEWPVVILPFMARRRKLKGSVTSKCKSKEEYRSKLYANECRLLYVACTRVKNTLLILDDRDFFPKKLQIDETSSWEILFG